MSGMLQGARADRSSTELASEWEKNELRLVSQQKSAAAADKRRQRTMGQNGKKSAY